MSHFLQIQRIRLLDSLPVPRIQNKRKHYSACTLSVQQCATVGVAGSLVSAWEVWEDPTLLPWEDNSAAMAGQLCCHGRMAGPVGAATMVDSSHKMAFSLKYETACAATMLLCQAHTGRDTAPYFAKHLPPKTNHCIPNTQTTDLSTLSQ